MAKHNWHFFKEEVDNPWHIEYKDLSNDEKFNKLYAYALELEERIEQLENNQ